MPPFLVWACVSLLLQSVSNASVVPARPNFIFVLVDDQDLLLDSLSYQPRVLKNLRDGGTQFKKHYCTTAVCCPARVSLLTGKMAHNTNITDVSPPYGMIQQRIYLDRGAQS